jgi:hypothetical protein
MAQQAEAQGAVELEGQVGREEAHVEDNRLSLESVPDPGLRLQAPVSTVVHVEMVLSRHSGRAAQPRPVSVTGSLNLPELRCELVIRGLPKLGGRDGEGEERRANAMIVPRNVMMPIPPQRLASSSGQEDDLWVLTPSAERDPPWTEHYAGRLDGGPIVFDYHVSADAILDVTLKPDEHLTGGWSNVDVAGELRFPSSTAMRLVLRAAAQTKALPPESQRDEVVLIPAGTRLAIRQTMLCPAGRDAWLTVRVIEAETRLVRAEQLLAGGTRNGG